VIFSYDFIRAGFSCLLMLTVSLVPSAFIRACVSFLGSVVYHLLLAQTLMIQCDFYPKLDWRILLVSLHLDNTLDLNRSEQNSAISQILANK
jgi:hypothetical protein